MFRTFAAPYIRERIDSDKNIPTAPFLSGTVDDQVMDCAARIEDLEEALRRIVVIISPDGCHRCCERDDAVLTIAFDQLGLDLPVIAGPRGSVIA